MMSGRADHVDAAWHAGKAYWRHYDVELARLKKVAVRSAWHMQLDRHLLSASTCQKPGQPH